MDHTSESIKSLEGFRIAWVDEAQTLSARSRSLLRPTIRAEASELWSSWNPRWKSDAIDDLLPGPKACRRHRREGELARDNPWFPAVLEDERKLDLAHFPERYDHIDAMVDARAEAVAKQGPGMPLGVIRNLLTARAGVCRCAQYLDMTGEDTDRQGQA